MYKSKCFILHEIPDITPHSFSKLDRFRSLGVIVYKNEMA